MNNYERMFFNVIIFMLAISITTMTLVLKNTEQLPLILPLLMIPITYFAFMQLKSPKPRYLSRMLGNLIAFLTLVFILFQGINYISPLTSILYFIYSLLFIKLLQKKKNRDYLQIILFSLAFMLISAVYQPAIWFLLIFVTYIVIGLWALILLHFKNEVEGTHSHDKKPVMNIDNTLMRRIFQGRVFAFITTLSVLTIVITTLGFLAMPRLRAGWFSPILPPIKSSSGLSDSVQLGGGGKIELDNKRALYVTWDEQPDSTILYRAVTQPIYTKTKRWVANDNTHLNFVDYSIAPKLTNIMSYAKIKKLGTNKVEIIDQQFNRSVLRFVTPGIPTDFKLIEPKKKIAIEYPAITVKAESAIYEPSVVYVTECLKSPKKYKDFWDAKPERWIGGFQDLPELKEKYINFVEEKCPPAEGKTGWDAERVRRLTQVLSEAPFTYTLEQPEIPKGRSPIDYFIFEGHAGHCEYYASALAMLLQTVGVKAHVVTGFASNPVNLQKIEGKWVDDVRNKQAHAWVEVKFKEWGWVPFNPTPGGFIPQFEEMSGFDRFLSMLQYKYQRYVLDFSIKDQKSIAKNIKSSITNIGEEIEKIGSDILSTILGDNEFPAWLKLLIGFIVFAIPITGLVLIYRRIKRKFIKKNNNVAKLVDTLDHEFKMILKVLEKLRRSRRTSSETFNEIINSSGISQFIDEQSIIWLRDIYWEIRFNSTNLNDDIRSKIRDFITRIKENRKKTAQVKQT